MRETELQRLEEHLASKHYTLKREWLKICIEFIESQTKKSLEFEQTANMILFQFLNSDIEKSYEPCMMIPANVAKMVLTRKMIFQVISYMNISLSVYEQLSAATKKNRSLSWFHGDESVSNQEEANNNEVKQNGKRGLVKFQLTDGKNKLFGVEIEEETFDMNQITPGAKIMLIDKVKIRNGVLLFNRSNCQIIGGLVDSLQYDMVEKFANLLKIDLNAETNRKKIALEKAMEMRKRRKEKQNLTQSTISPFLVKKNTLKQPVEPSKSDSFDDIIAVKSTISAENPQGKSNATGREPEFKDFTFTPIPSTSTKHAKVVSNNDLRKDDSKREESNQTPNNSSLFQDVGSWSFNLKSKDSNNSSIRLDPVNVRKPPPPVIGVNRRKTKELSRSLLEVPETIPKESEPIVEKYEPEKLMNLHRDEDRREPVGNTRVERISSDILPLEFIQKDITSFNRENKPDKSASVETFSRSIHGPRGGIPKKPVQAKIQAKNSEDSNALITNFFNTVKILGRKSEEQRKSPEKNGNSKLKGIITPIQIDEYNQEYESSSDSSGIETFEKNGNDEDNSILECTIDREGVKECERWGINIHQKPSKRQRENDDILKSWNPEVMSFKITKMEQNSEFEHSEVINIANSNGVGEGKCSISAGPSIAPFSRPSAPNYGNNQKALIRQSDNVQVYKTPLPKRIPSSDSSNKFTSELFIRLSNLNVVNLKEALMTRKYWMMSKIVVIMPTICHQMHPIQCNGIDWQLKLRINDTSISNVTCFVSTDLLNRIFGFTVLDCKKLFDNSKMDVLQAKKQEAEQKLSGFKRLDLIMWVEISPQLDKFPIVVDVKTISDAMNIL